MIAIEQPRTPYGLIALEQGERIEEWSQFQVGGGLFGLQTIAGGTAPVFGWENNAGAARGAFAFRIPTSLLGVQSSPAGYTGAHTVHLRISGQGNRSASVCLAPATAVHTGGGGNPGNCYFAQAAYSAGTRQVLIRKVRAGVESTLATVTAAVEPGDVLSLGYRWNTAGSSAELLAMVNGVAVTAAVDSVLAFDLVGLSASLGLWGASSPAIPAGAVGHWSAEWWASALLGSYSPPVSRFPAGVGTFKAELYTAQRFTDDPAPRLKFLIADEITRAEWSFRRNGGCDAATIRFRPQQNDSFSAVNYPANLETERWFEEPPADDWAANDWLGGLLILRCSYRTATLGQLPIDERLWTGRIASVRVDRETREVTIEAEGLSAAFAEVFVYSDFKQTLRDAIIALVREVVAKGPRSGFPLRAQWIAYNAAKITGVGSTLDQPVNLEFRFESARSVLDRLLRLLPDGFVWGVDREGDFYLSYSLDNYAADMGADGTAVPIQTFFADRCASWSRVIDVTEIRNQVTVIGTTDPDSTAPGTGPDVGRLAAQAVCTKSVSMHGLRDDIIQEDEARDVGLAAKLAQAACKRAARPRITGELVTTERIIGTSSFFESLVSFAPAIAVVDRVVQENIQESSLPRQAEYILRRWGDEPGVSVREDGATGYVQMDRGPLEEFDTGWLLHLSMRFTTAHPGPAANWAFIFGRPGAAAARKGWGALYWNEVTGGLEWWYEDSGGTQRVFPTGILVNTVTPANQVVHFTLTRIGNTWTARNGNTVTGTNSVLPHPKVGTGDPWRWCRHPYAGAGADKNWAGDFDSLWMFQTSVFSGPQGQNEGIAGQNSGGIAAFVSRNNARALRRDDAIGQLLSVRFGREIPYNLSSQRKHAGWRVSGTDLVSGVGALVEAVQQGSAQSMPASVTTSDANAGHVLGKPKRWGGPLRLAVDTATYEWVGGGRIKRTMTLGEAAVGQALTVARVQDQVRAQAELLRREPAST